jgi:hypothetical protein
MPPPCLNRCRFVAVLSQLAPASRLGRRLQRVFEEFLVDIESIADWRRTAGRA